MMTDGFLLLDKPSGPTSHDLVLWARRALPTRRVGHCGTLDPMASGLLVLAAGDALKLQEKLTGARKTYRATLRLGLSTDTDDITGKPISPPPVPSPSRGEGEGGGGVSEMRLRQTLAGFLGPQNQKVPKYSAVKVGGRRLYELARAGTDVELPVKSVEIFRLDLLSYQPPEAEILMECSKGTYVRALARDVGEALGVGACLSALRREAIGPLRREAAYSWRPGPAPEGALEKAFIPAAELPRLS